MNKIVFCLFLLFSKISSEKEEKNHKRQLLAVETAGALLFTIFGGFIIENYLEEIKAFNRDNDWSKNNLILNDYINKQKCFLSDSKTISLKGKSDTISMQYKFLNMVITTHISNL